MVRLPDGMAQSSASILVLGQSLGLSAAQHFYVPLHTYLCMYIYSNIFQLFLFSHFILQHSVVFLFFFFVFSISAQFLFFNLLFRLCYAQFLHICACLQALSFTFFSVSASYNQFITVNCFLFSVDSFNNFPATQSGSSKSVKALTK